MDFEVNTKRTDLANAFAAAGADLLAYTGTGAALAAIPDTNPQQYAAAGTLELIRQIWPESGASPASGSVAVDLDKLRRFTSIGYAMAPLENGPYVYFDDVERLVAAARTKEPVAWLRLRAEQHLTGQSDIGVDERLEVCEPGGVGTDGAPAFPVYGSPAAEVDAKLVAVREVALEEAAREAERAEIAIGMHGMILHDDGAGTVANIAAAIRALAISRKIPVNVTSEAPFSSGAIDLVKLDALARAALEGLTRYVLTNDGELAESAKATVKCSGEVVYVSDVERLFAAAGSAQQDKCAPPFAAPACQHAAIVGAIARGWFANVKPGGRMNDELVHAIASEVESELASRCRAQGCETITNSSEGAAGSASTAAATEPNGHVVDVDHDADESIINIALEPGTAIYLAAPSSDAARLGEPTPAANGSTSLTDLRDAFCEASDYLVLCPDQAAALFKAMTTPGAAPSSDDVRNAAWISVDERLPEVAVDDDKQFIVACRRGHNGGTYVFAANYLNARQLHNDDEGAVALTGWYIECEHPEYNGWFEPVCQAGDEVTHWMPLPEAPRTSTKDQDNSKGGDHA